ncbi:MAG: hypothetical protein ACRQFF_00675 [Sphaerochaeta sp.]
MLIPNISQLPVLAIFEKVHKNTSSGKKDEKLFQILMDVKDSSTYEELSNKIYPEL